MLLRKMAAVMLANAFLLLFISTSESHYHNTCASCQVLARLPSGALIQGPISVPYTTSTCMTKVGFLRGRAVTKRAHTCSKLCATCQLFGGDGRQTGSRVRPAKSCVSANRRPRRHEYSPRLGRKTLGALGAAYGGPAACHG